MTELMPRSRDWVCPTCQVKNHELLGDVEVTAGTPSQATGADEEAIHSSPKEESCELPLDSRQPDPPLLSLSTTPRPLSIPTPPTATSSSETASSTLPSIRTRAESPSQPVPSPRRPPVILDLALFLMISLLVVLVARRLA